MCLVDSNLGMASALRVIASCSEQEVSVGGMPSN